MNVKYREYNPNQCHFILFTPQVIAENNPLLRAIHEFIEEHVLLAPFAEKVKNEETGAPAVHPKMMLKVLFYSYANGVFTSREIEERLRWDQNYIYLSGNQQVDHSTICNFILFYKAEIKSVFTKLLYIMAKKGYVTMEFVVVDGTKIKADVGKRFTGCLNEFKKKRERIAQKIEKMLKHTVGDGVIGKGKTSKEDKLNMLRAEKEKIDAFLNEVRGLEESLKDMVISLTDRDARMVKDKDTKYMGYNCQVAVDSKADVIVSPDVFNDAADNKLLQPMVGNIKEQTKNDLKNTELGFDGGYFSSNNLEYAHEEELPVYLPEGRGEGGEKQRAAEKIESKDCQIACDGESKRLVCPGGQVMELSGVRKMKGDNYYKFYPDEERCQDCTLKDKCRQGIKGEKSFLVKQGYYDTFPLRKEMMEKLSSAKGKQRMAERFWVIEHVFGEIKEILGFRRFLHRGLEKVRLIWTMICTAYNFRKLARLAYGW